VLHARGQCEWFGAWCDGVLAADCGLVRDRAAPGATGRFQRVATHPAWRRRGLCSALVHHVSRHAQQAWGVAEVIMVADPADVAIGIYRGLGYRAFEQEWCLERRAPEDQRAA
jgi:ribosomal protein S18 acetylase RimI-like enzyme